MRNPGFDGAMRVWSRFTAESVFLIAGLLIIALGWISDLIGIVDSQAGAGLHGSGDIVSRIWFTFFGLLFVAGGTGYEQPWRILNDSKFAKRYLVSLLFFADGAFHLYAFNDHLNVSLVEAGFFAVLAPVQFAFGLLIPRLPPEYDAYMLVLPVFSILLLVVALIVPVWPLDTVEDIYSLTLVSKATEGLTILTLLSLMKEDGTLTWAALKRAARPAGR